MRARGRGLWTEPTLSWLAPAIERLPACLPACLLAYLLACYHPPACALACADAHRPSIAVASAPAARQLLRAIELRVPEPALAEALDLLHRGGTPEVSFDELFPWLWRHQCVPCARCSRAVAMC